uniref:Uncharacterized protein n=1 Tax=Oryza rufipogon TaxID=4529 RepID=A0A0E0PX84_ORYRU
MVSGYRIDIDNLPADAHLALIAVYITNNGLNRINLNNFLIICWQLWKARNDIKFQGIFKEPSQVCYMADAMANSYMHVLSQSNLQDQEQSELEHRRMDSIPNGNRCFVRWVPREVNKMADKLAKEAKSGTRRNFIQNCQNIEHSAYPHRSFYARLLNDNFRSLNCTINYVLCF